MWSYYGGKTSLVKYYPKPVHDRIIEPFAGAAAYSLKHFEKEVLLVDINPVIINIWKYLQQCSVSDIKGLPALTLKQRIRREDFSCEGEFNLMQFLINQGAFHPANIVQKFGLARYESTKRNIISGLHKIKHWNVIQGTYLDIPNREATWFVDAPYVFGGEKYTFSSKKIDYNTLSYWCKERYGQTIVCENTKASWLPFNPIKQHTGINKKVSTEGIWTNFHTHYNNQQQSLIY